MPFGDALPVGDQVTRGCSRGYDKGEVTPSAFALRGMERSQLRISVDWVECPYADRVTRNIEGSTNRLRAASVRLPYAVLRVADIRRVRRGEWALDVNEFGGLSNACHCGIGGFSATPIDLELQSDLAQIANKSPVIGVPV